MADHYYSRNPEVKSDPIYWDAELRGKRLKFKTDQGVFSKKEIDFGSRFLLDMFESPALSGPILDAGCGYGPIGLTLAKESPDRMIHMIDVNSRALELTRENADLNEIGNVKIYESDRLESVEENGFAAILTNPPIRAGKQVVHDILSQSWNRLAAGGELWVVIQKKQGAPSAKAKLEELFESVETAGKNKGYYVFRAKK